MTEKRSKYDTDPLDPDFVRRAEEELWGARRAPRPDETDPLPPASVTEEQTRRFDEQPPDSYPSVFVPPAYQPPRAQPFTTFGAGPHEPPATTATPPPGPSSPYDPARRPYAPPTSRPVAKLGLPENITNVLPYLPFYIGLVAAVVELLIVPRTETRTRFHAAQGLALQLAVVAGSIFFQAIRGVTGSGIGGVLFGIAAAVFLVVSAIRVWQGKPHHVAPLDEVTRQLNERISPVNK